MDSAGIGLIIGRYKLMESLGGELVVSHLSPKMEQIVSLSGVGKLAKIEKGKQMMKPMNEMSLSFLSYSANEGFARATVAAFVAQMDPTVGRNIRY